MPVLPLLALATGLSGATPAIAQRLPPLQPGEILFDGSDHKTKVLACRPVIWGRECQTVAWKDNRADSNPAWWDEQLLASGDARVRAALGLPPRGGVTTSPTGAARMATSGVAKRVSAAGTAAKTTSARTPDGTYTCQIWMRSSYVNLGTVRSVGGKLSPDIVAKTGGTITGATATAEGITISYTTARGYRESMDCKRN